MKTNLFALAMVVTLSAHAKEANFGSFDCEKPISGTYPKLMLVADQRTPDLQAQGINDLSIQIEVKFANGRSESYILPNQGGRGLVAAVPLLGRINAAAPIVDYQISKQFNFEPQPGLPSFVETSGQWLKTNKENLCFSSGIRPIRLSWSVSDSIAADMKSVISLELAYQFEGSDLQYSSKPTVISGQKTLESIFIVEDAAKKLSFSYTLTYLNQAGRSVRLSPQSVELSIPNN